MIHGFAWALEIPPEVLTLSFRSNYSASKAAENNLDVYLFKTRYNFGAQFCAPIYRDWLISEALRGAINAPRLLAAWRDRSDLVAYSAWTSSTWSGNIKPSVDPVKQVNGYALAIEQGFMTRARACREVSGMKFTQVARQLRKEHSLLAEANEHSPVLKTQPAPEFVEPEEDDEEEKDDDSLVN